MKILFIILQFGASISDPLSNTRLGIFWGVVFLLVSLFIFFLYRTNKIIERRNQEKTVNDSKSHNHSNYSEISDEAVAAIALAIHKYKSDLHDQESFTITLKKVSKIYSPWSSKIYTLRQNPR